MDYNLWTGGKRRQWSIVAIGHSFKYTDLAFLVPKFSKDGSNADHPIEFEFCPGSLSAGDYFITASMRQRDLKYPYVLIMIIYLYHFFYFEIMVCHVT